MDGENDSTAIPPASHAEPSAGHGNAGVRRLRVHWRVSCRVAADRRTAVAADQAATRSTAATRAPRLDRPVAGRRQALSGVCEYARVVDAATTSLVVSPRAGAPVAAAEAAAHVVGRVIGLAVKKL